VNQFIGAKPAPGACFGHLEHGAIAAPEKEKAMQLYDYGAAANARHDDHLRAFDRAQRCGLTLRIESSSELDPDAATQRGFFEGLRRRFANVLTSDHSLANQAR
jgi:hypothetical protein